MTETKTHASYTKNKNKNENKIKYHLIPILFKPIFPILISLSFLEEFSLKLSFQFLFPYHSWKKKKNKNINKKNINILIRKRNKKSVTTSASVVNDASKGPTYEAIMAYVVNVNVHLLAVQFNQSLSYERSPTCGAVKATLLVIIIVMIVHGFKTISFLGTKKAKVESEAIIHG